MVFLIIGTDSQPTASIIISTSPSLSTTVTSVSTVTSVPSVSTSQYDYTTTSSIIQKWIEENLQFAVHFIQSNRSDGQNVIASHYHDAQAINRFYSNEDLGISPVDAQFVSFTQEEGSPATLEDTGHYLINLYENGFSFNWAASQTETPNGNRNVVLIVFPQQIYAEIFISIELPWDGTWYGYADVSVDKMIPFQLNLDDPSSLLETIPQTLGYGHKLCIARAATTASTWNSEKLNSCYWRGTLRALQIFTIRKNEVWVNVRPLAVVE